MRQIKYNEEVGMAYDDVEKGKTKEEAIKREGNWCEMRGRE